MLFLTWHLLHQNVNYLCKKKQVERASTCQNIFLKIYIYSQKTVCKKEILKDPNGSNLYKILMALLMA